MGAGEYKNNHGICLADKFADDVSLETHNESTILSNIAPDKSVLLVVPHSDASAFHAMVRVLLSRYPTDSDPSVQRVNITVEYTTIAEPDVVRTLQLVRFVLTDLPVAINVEDFFRGTRYAISHVQYYAY